MVVLKGACGEQELEKKLQEKDLNKITQILKEIVLKKETKNFISPRYREKTEENF